MNSQFSSTRLFAIMLMDFDFELMNFKFLMFTLSAYI